MAGTVLWVYNRKQQQIIVIRPCLYFGQIKFWLLVEMKDYELGLETLGSNSMPLVCLSLVMLHWASDGILQMFPKLWNGYTISYLLKLWGFSLRIHMKTFCNI